MASPISRSSRAEIGGPCRQEGKKNETDISVLPPTIRWTLGLGFRYVRAMGKFTLLLVLGAFLFFGLPRARAAAEDSEASTSRLKLDKVKAEAADEDDDDDSAEADEGSEFFSMPEAKKVKAEFAVGVNQSSYLISGGGKYEALVSNIRADLSYGFNENVGVSAEFAFSSGRQHYENDSNTQGLEDILLNLNMTNKLGSDKNWIRYGIETTLSPDRYVEDNDDSTNRFSGGRWAAPYVGFEFRRDFGTAGLKYSYEKPLGLREATFRGVDEEYPGGDTAKLTVFYERYVMPKVLLMTHLEYARSSRIDIYEGEAFSGVSPEYTLVLGFNIEQGKFTHTPEISFIATTDSEVDGTETLGTKFEGMELDYHLGF
jgi:hypothetical protein